MTGLRRRLFILYSINQGIHWFSVGIVIPVMVLALMEPGFDIGQVGIAMGIMGASVMLLELPTGGLADAIGRKRVYMIAIVFYIAGYACVFFAVQFYQLAGAVLLIGTGRALSSGSMDAWYIDEHKAAGLHDGQLQEDLARTGVVIPAALGAGTLLGGLIPEITGFYRGNIIVLLGFYLLQLFLTAVLIKEDRSRFPGRIRDGFKAFPAVLGSAVRYGLTRRNTLAVLVATAALGIGLSGLEQLWQPRVKEIAPESASWFLGLLSAGYFLSAAGGNAVASAVIRFFRGSYKAVLFCFRLIMALLYIVLASASELGSFMPLYFVLFFAHGITGSPEMTVYNSGIPPEKRSSLLSLNSLFLQAGGAAGSVAAGQIALRLSIPAAWLVSGSLLAVSSFAYLAIKYENKIQSGC